MNPFAPIFRAPGKAVGYRRIWHPGDGPPVEIFPECRSCLDTGFDIDTDLPCRRCDEYEARDRRSREALD